jgi:hypothetical protein
LVYLSRGKERYGPIAESLNKITVSALLSEKLSAKFLFVHDGSVLLHVLHQVWFICLLCLFVLVYFFFFFCFCFVFLKLSAKFLFVHDGSVLLHVLQQVCIVLFMFFFVVVFFFFFVKWRNFYLFMVDVLLFEKLSAKFLFVHDGSVLLRQVCFVVYCVCVCLFVFIFYFVFVLFIE